MALKKTERTREKLIDAIREEIRESGIFNAERVSQRAGISTATFYNHFADKDDALSGAYEVLMRELIQLVADQCRIEKLLDEGLDDFVGGWILRVADFFRQNNSSFRLAQAAFARSKHMRDLFRQHEVEAIQHYRRLVELGQVAGVIRQGDQEAIAQVIAVFSEGWNHSLLLNLEAVSPLHQALTESMVRILEPK